MLGSHWSWMIQEGYYPTEKVCDISGHTGVVDAILKSTQCKVNREHMYCARVLVKKKVDGRICGKCESSSKSMLETSPLLGQGSKSICVSRQKSRAAYREFKISL